MKELRTITLGDRSALQLEVLNYGATLTSLKVPDHNGKQVDVVVGLAEPGNYLDRTYLDRKIYLGSTIGRYAGRIAGGMFSVNGEEYKLHQFDGAHLHGGKEGLDKKFWNIETLYEGKDPYVTLSCTSPHMEEGYPGNVKVWATYQVKGGNTLCISYKAITDAQTPLNITNHAYFNLNGQGSVKGHFMKVASDRYLEKDHVKVPTGRINASGGTRFDYRELSDLEAIGTAGLDDTFILSSGRRIEDALLYAPESGITMKIITNQPAFVIYTPPQLNGLELKGTYSNFPAICFEAQNYPNAPNESSFPSPWLHPGERYENTTSFVFSNSKL